jgi:hypothetical protein
MLPSERGDMLGELRSLASRLCAAGAVAINGLAVKKGNHTVPAGRRDRVVAGCLPFCV